MKAPWQAGNSQTINKHVQTNWPWLESNPIIFTFVTSDFKKMWLWLYMYIFGYPGSPNTFSVQAESSEHGSLFKWSRRSAGPLGIYLSIWRRIWVGTGFYSFPFRSFPEQVRVSRRNGSVTISGLFKYGCVLVIFWKVLIFFAGRTVNVPLCFLFFVPESHLTLIAFIYSG